MFTQSKYNHHKTKGDKRETLTKSSLNVPTAAAWHRLVSLGYKVGQRTAAETGPVTVYHAVRC